jgi:WD40 repeat protein
VLLEPAVVDPRFLARSRRESRLAAALEHPAVVPVYDVGEVAGAFFIAMQRVHGRDLGAVLAARTTMPVDDVVALLAPIADALDAASVLGLVHRDVKPSNILVADDGRSFLVDFGLARSRGTTTDPSSTDRLVGTIDYIAPEQITGDPIDGRADQYSLACVAFECLTGRRPFERDSELGTLWAHVEEPAPLPSSFAPGLPRSIDRALAVGLAKDPSARFESCGKLIARLAAPDREDGAQTPFVGLAAFDAGDAPFFFGRERLVATIVDRLCDEPLLALVGSSGSGKSSVLRAGVLPALARRHSFVPVLVRPGEHPARALEKALGGPIESAVAALAPDVKLVLAIDQLEEVFTLCRDDDERDAFVSMLVEAAASGCLRTLLAIRDDFLGSCAAIPSLAQLLGERVVLVGAMSRSDLEQTIVGPAARSGVGVETELVEELLADAGEEPGALPLLATTMRELWQAREGNTLTLRAYRAQGGLQGAIARRGEQTWSALGPDERERARRILLRLAETGPSGEPVRRRVSRLELGADDDPVVAHAIDALIENRLLVQREGIVEVAHEALFREWPRLRTLLEQDSEGRVVRLALAEDAAAWSSAGRDTGDVYRGARLAGALEWSRGREAELNRVELEYLDAGRRLAMRSQRRLRIVIGVLAMLLALAVAAAVTAVDQRRSARAEARVALARQLGAESVSAPRLDQAMLLAREATELDPSGSTDGTLLTTLLRSPAALETFTVPLGTKPYRLDVTPDGRTLVVGDQQGRLRFYDTRTRREVGDPDTDVNGFLPIDYSRDGSLMLAAAPGFPSPGLRLLDARSRRVEKLLPFDYRYVHPPIDTGAVTPLGLSADERTAFFAYDLTVDQAGTEGPAYLDVWDVLTGQRTTRSLGSNDVVGAGFVGATDRVVTVTSTQIATWSLSPLRRLRTTPIGGGRLGGFAAVSPDGTTVAALRAAPSSLVFIDVRSGKVTPARGADATGGVLSVAFSPDGATVVTTGSAQKVVLWNAVTGAETDAFVGHGGATNSAVFTPDGRTLYSSSLDGAIFAWDIAGSRRFGRRLTLPSQPQQLPNVPQAPPLAVSPGSSTFAMRDGAAQLALYAVATGARQALVGVRNEGRITALAWSPRGPLLAVGGLHGPLQLWSTAGRPRVLRSLAGLGAVQAIAFSGDGRTVAAVDAEDGGKGRLALWSTASGRPIRDSLRLRTAGTSVAFAPDGSLVAVGLENGQVDVVDGGTGLVARVIRPIGAFGVTVAFAPDGTLLTGSFAGIVQRWNAVSGAQLGRATRVTAGPVASISFGRGRTLFSASSLTGGDVGLWTIPSLQQFGSDFPGDPFVLTSARMTPDGRSLVVVFNDGGGYVWPLSPDGWEQRACAIAGRNFSRDEWAQFVGSRPYAKTCSAFPAGS